MKVTIVGAGGFIGRHLSAALKKAGHEVAAISSADSYFDADTGLLSRALPADAAVDAVVYLSQSPRYRDVPQHAAHLWAVNVVSAIAAAEWARGRGARQFVYASSGTVYQPSFQAHPETDPLRRDRWYALSKVHAEEALQQFQGDLDVTCARFFGVYGPGQRGKLVPNLLSTIQSRGTVQIQPHPRRADDNDGVRLSLIHVEDAARALIALLEQRRPGPINVASTEVFSIRDLANAIGGVTGVQPVFATAAEPREGDVIADPSQLSALLARPFISFASAIGGVVAAEAAR